MQFCTCAECGITKTKFVKQSKGSGIGSTLLTTALDLGMAAAPLIGKKALQAGRYYASEAMRNPKLQQKAIDFALDKAKPILNKVGKEAITQLSPSMRPKRKDGKQLHTTDIKGLDYGGAIDIHKAIDKLPKPKKGWTLPGHKYTGPYNDLENQVRYNPDTGEIFEIYDQPTGKTDTIAMYHDIDYSICKDDRKCKNKADRKMVKALDNIPYNERQCSHWLARNVINTKQKLGLGVKQRKKINGKGRRVRKTGKKNKRMNYIRL